MWSKDVTKECENLQYRFLHTYKQSLQIDRTHTGREGALGVQLHLPPDRRTAVRGLYEVNRAQCDVHVPQRTSTSIYCKDMSNKKYQTMIGFKMWTKSRFQTAPDPIRRMMVK